MKYPNWIGEKIRTAVPLKEEDLKTLHPLIKEIVGLSEKARREGLIVLDDTVSELSTPLLRMGIMMICDGIEPESIMTAMENTMLTAEKPAIEFLQDLIIIEGIIGIQSGQNPRVLEFMLKALLGIDEVFNSDKYK